MPVEKQIAIIYCGTRGLLRDVPVHKVKNFEADFIETLELRYRTVLDSLRDGNLTTEITDTLEKVAAEVASRYKY